MRQEVSFSAIGLRSPLGATFLDSTTAYAASRTALRRYPPLVGPDGRPPTLACGFHPFVCEYFDERLWTLFAYALQDCEECWTAQGTPSGAGLAAFPAFVLLPAQLATSDAGHAFRSRLSSSPLGASVAAISYGDGGAAGLSLLEEVQSRISAGSLPGALICAVDSLIDPAILDRLYAHDHALHKDNPYGFVPGEGAAALLLLPPRPEISPFGQLVSVATRQEAMSGPNVVKRRAMIELLRELETPDSGEIRVHVDLCGPRWCAEEFGMAMTAVGGRLCEAAAEMEVAALQVGYMGVVDALCRLIFALGDPPSKTPKPAYGHSLIIAMSESGGRAAAVVQSFGRGPHARNS